MQCTPAYKALRKARTGSAIRPGGDRNRCIRVSTRVSSWTLSRHHKRVNRDVSLRHQVLCEMHMPREANVPQAHAVAAVLRTRARGGTCDKAHGSVPCGDTEGGLGELQRGKSGEWRGEG